MRAALILLALVAATWLLAPNMLMVVAGASLMAVGAAWLLLWLLWPRHLRHPLGDGLILGGLVGWLLGRPRH